MIGRASPIRCRPYHPHTYKYPQKHTIDIYNTHTHARAHTPSRLNVDATPGMGNTLKCASLYIWWVMHQNDTWIKNIKKIKKENFKFWRWKNLTNMKQKYIHFLLFSWNNVYLRLASQNIANILRCWIIPIVFRTETDVQIHFSMLPRFLFHGKGVYGKILQKIQFWQ